MDLITWNIHIIHNVQYISRGMRSLVGCVWSYKARDCCLAASQTARVQRPSRVQEVHNPSQRQAFVIGCHRCTGLCQGSKAAKATRLLRPGPCRSCSHRPLDRVRIRPSWKRLGLLLLGPNQESFRALMVRSCAAMFWRSLKNAQWFTTCIIE
jgi:hypothetical protein